MAVTSSSSCLNPKAPEFLPAVTQTVPVRFPYPYYFSGRTDCYRPTMSYYNAVALFPYSHHFPGGIVTYKTAEPVGISAGGGQEKKFDRPFGFRRFNRNYLPPRLRKPRIWEAKKTEIPVGRDSVYNRKRDNHDKPGYLLGGKTSVMIKNIPNKFGRNDLLKILDTHCRKKNIEARRASDKHPSSYDFLYLPMDFVKQMNLGYAFVNFTSSVAAEIFCRDFDKFFWEVPGNKKICQVTLAKYQGRVELSRHFKCSRFICHTDAYLPVVLSPPSDGFVHYTLTLLGERIGGLGGASIPPPSVSNQKQRPDV